MQQAIQAFKKGSTCYESPNKFNVPKSMSFSSKCILTSETIFGR